MTTLEFADQIAFAPVSWPPQPPDTRRRLESGGATLFSDFPRSFQDGQENRDPYSDVFNPTPRWITGVRAAAVALAGVRNRFDTSETWGKVSLLPALARGIFAVKYRKAWAELIHPSVAKA